ncbi:hypothetical protein [Halomonas sp. YLGW01]|uniref:hypothetical protein n=1 Tax=Halomonas sp. YLGW01 TaxID=2773308 RepID=UPI001786D237|nr:hypothetical protein [Halomonas sp. YLGW01]
MSLPPLAGRRPGALPWASGLALLTALLAASPGQASDFWTYDHGLAQTSLWTTHYSTNEDGDEAYNDRQHLIGLELHNPTRWLAGTAWLKNSFDQPIWYFYAGREFPLWQPGQEFEVRAKLTAGALRGYDGENQDKIDYNSTGVAPAILPTLGARFGRLEGDLLLFGTAGAMLTAGVRF